MPSRHLASPRRTAAIEASDGGGRLGHDPPAKWSRCNDWFLPRARRSSQHRSREQAIMCGRLRTTSAVHRSPAVEAASSRRCLALCDSCSALSWVSAACLTTGPADWSTTPFHQAAPRWSGRTRPELAEIRSGGWLVGRSASVRGSLSTVARSGLAVAWRLRAGGGVLVRARCAGGASAAR